MAIPATIKLKDYFKYANMLGAKRRRIISKYTENPYPVPNSRVAFGIKGTKRVPPYSVPDHLLLNFMGKNIMTDEDLAELKEIDADIKAISRALK